MIIFFRFPYNFAIEVSPLIQTTLVSTKKITVEGMSVFFPISDKGWKEKRKERERRMKRAVEHQLTTSGSSSQGSFFLGTSGWPVRISTSQENINCWLTYSLDLSRKKNWLQKTNRFLSPVGGGRGGWTIHIATMVISSTAIMKIAAQKAALQNLRS